MIDKRTVQRRPMRTTLLSDEHKRTLAATVGRARIVEHAAVTWRGSYLTIWRNTADGWRVVLDVGRNENTL